MEEVRKWLSLNGLGDYSSNFEKDGWDDLSLLSEMNDCELKRCIQKPGHRARFRKALRSSNPGFPTPKNKDENDVPLLPENESVCDRPNSTQNISTSNVYSASCASSTDHYSSMESAIETVHDFSVETAPSSDQRELSDSTKIDENDIDLTKITLHIGQL